MPGDRAVPIPSAGNSPDAEAEFERVPADMIAEIIDGVVFAQARPGSRQTRAASALQGRSVRWLRRGES